MVVQQFEQAQSETNGDQCHYNFKNKLFHVLSRLCFFNNDCEGSPNRKQNKAVDKHQKGEEVFIVVLANANPQPGTVVIVSLHAVVASPTVDGPDRSVYMTLNTVFQQYRQTRWQSVDVVAIRYRVVVDWRQLVQSLVPLVVVHILGKDARIGVDAQSHRDDCG